MRKFTVVFVLLTILLVSCNFPTAQEDGLTIEQQAATVVAQTLTAVARTDQVPLASPTLETTQQPEMSPTASGETATSQPGISPTAATGTSTATILTVDSNTNCREGPGTTYTIVIVLVPDTNYQMIARTADNTYWIVTEIGKSTICWVPAEKSNAFGDVSLLPVTTPSAPTSAVGALQAPSALRYEYSCVFNGVGSDITVKLSWSDRSNNEDGFRVYRDGVLVATLAANTTFYSEVFAGGSSTLYSYRVSSYNAAGEAMGSPITFSCSG